MHVCLTARSVSASRVPLRSVGERARNVAVFPKGVKKRELSGRGFSREQGPNNTLGSLQGSGSYLSAGVITDQF